jgi:hypothetical protein
MRVALVITATAIFFCGSTFGREIAVEPAVPLHPRSVVVELQTSDLGPVASAKGVGCTTRYVTTTKGVGGRITRRSVDCDE